MNLPVRHPHVHQSGAVKTPRLDAYRSRLKAQADRLALIVSPSMASVSVPITLEQLRQAAEVCASAMLCSTAQQPHHRKKAIAEPGVSRLRLDAALQLLTPLHSAAHRRRQI